MKRTTLALLLAPWPACVDDPPAPTGASTDTTTTTTATTTTTTLDPPQPEPQGVDSTGAPSDPACLDDYHGNQDLASALPLGLDTSDDATVSLGDGFAATPVELGGDALSVCAASPSDFFALQAQCAAYLSIEVRSLDGGNPPDLLLHDDAGQPVEAITGGDSDFFLVPLQRRIAAGSYAIEARHAGDDVQTYRLTVIVLPGAPCGP